MPNFEIPKLTDSLHKGQMGRIGIIGGSENYTGAPFYCAMAAMRTGADLAYIFTPSHDSAPVIQSYSPDVIVVPGLNSKLESKWTEKLHSLVVGPGLGDVTLENLDALRGIVNHWLTLDRPLIVDADGIYNLFLAQNDNNCSILQNLSGERASNITVTPNKIEFERLCQKYTVSDSTMENSTAQLALAMGGITICRKGKVDCISNGSLTTLCSTIGSPRRCGGQGDVLAGVIAVYLHWATLNGNEVNEDKQKQKQKIEAVKEACSFVRNISLETFKKHGRSMLTSDMLQQMATLEQ